MRKRHLLFILALLLNMAAHAENIAQVIWTEGNTTLTFLSSENLYAQGDDLNGQTVTNVWSGEDVTNSPTWFYHPKWNSSVNSSLTTVVFDESFKDVKPQSTAYWFYECSKLQSIKRIENLNTENVTTMRAMFYYCSGLTSLDLNSFNTQNVTDMGSMFSYCSSLTSLDLSSFNTQNVTDMGRMFWDCSSLTSLDLSSFNTQNVTDMGSMFYNCSGLTSLDLSSFNTQNVTYMGSMFSGCSGLTSLDVSGFNTQNVTMMDDMFAGCSGLTSLDVSGFNTQNVTNMTYMFRNCSGLTSLDVSGFNTQSVEIMSDMFYGCSGLTSLDLSSFNTQNVTDMGSMFYNCSGLTSLDLSGFNTQNVTDMSSMFSGCSGLTSLDLSSINTQNVTDMSSMFYGCSGLTSLDLSNFNTQNVTDMYSMFRGCSGLTSLDLSNFNTQNVKDMSYMFSGCSGLTSLDLSSFNTQNVKDMSYMFYYCSGLTSIDLSSFNTQNVTSAGSMFTDSAIIFISADASQTILSGRKFNMVLKAEDGSFSCANFVPKENMEFDIPYTFAAKITDTGHIYEVRYVIGWNTKADGTGITYQTGQTDAVIYKGKTTFYPIAFGRVPLAVWTEGNTTLTFLLSYDTPFTAGEGLNGQAVTKVWSESDVTNSPTSPRWNSSVSSSLTTVVFDESFKDVKPQSTNRWFSGCSKLQSIEGIENLNTENVTIMSYMFSGCSGLPSLDLSNFNTQNVTNMNSMFNNTGSAIIFIPADTKQNILSQRDFNMVLKAADDSFSCENFVPIDSVELNIPYAFTATLTSEAPQKEGLTFTGWNTMSDGSGTNYVPGQTDAVIEKGLVTFYPIFYDPTNIQMQQAERTGDTRYYNLRGMRMEQPRKGLNITVDKNGRSRKVMMR